MNKSGTGSKEPQNAEKEHVDTCYVVLDNFTGHWEP